MKELGGEAWPKRCARVLMLPAAAALAALALPIPKFEWGHDGPIHVANILSLERALREGEPLPRWVDGYNGGYGGPNFKYYSFFAYYPAALLKLVLDVDVLTALGLSLRIATAAGFLGAARLVCTLFGRRWALLGGALHAFYPYRCVLISTRLALPECLAYDLAPWAFFATWRAAIGKSPMALAAAAAASAALLCLHNLAAILWLPPLLLWAFAAPWVVGKPPRPLLALRLAVAALLLSAFQFLPSLFELSWIQAGERLADLDLYRNWSLPVWSLFSYPAVEALSAKLSPGPTHMALFLGAVAKVSLDLFRARGKGTGRGRPGCSETTTPRTTRPIRLSVFLAALGLSALALTTRASYLVGSLLPFLAVIQFPWRHLAVAGLFMTLAAIDVASWCARKVPAPVVTLFLIAQLLLLDRRYLAAVPVGYPIRKLEDLASTVFTGDYEDKYLPRGARLPPAPLRRAWESSGELNIFAERIDPARLILEFSSEGALEIRVLRYFFPGWRARLDGRPVALGRDPLDGAMLVRVEHAGRHRLCVERRRTALEQLYALLSAASALSLFAPWRSARRVCALVSGLVLAVALTIGMAAHEGFCPRGELLSNLLSDRMPSPGGGGWKLRSYAGSHFAGELGLSTVGSLNLAPGHGLRC